MNTRYFHSVIKAKRVASRIFTIQNMQGETVQSTDAVADAFREFYTSLLGTNKQNRDHVASHIAKEGQIVSEEQMSQLIRDFSQKEVKEAIWDIEGTKAPGPDGHGSQFFKDSWTIVGEDITAAVLEFFQSGKCSRLLIVQ
ncbi:PREDICTED: uncharacterized protein LOC109211664 [Nicotiana attenuata]|uniref:uncharacterized protein LOC109211664 n=1 Tax=Nicotiana attenuata TaxID=49451 RepID=UPI00090479B0|nr:PREDICTED: uncharacterized protein LOC109211664 [Nicotiana attenuata]